MSYRKTMFIIMLGVMCVSSRALADTNVSEKDESVRRLGVALNIAEDRKIENIAGIYQAESLDKYMKRYFDRLSLKVDQLIDQNNRLENKIDELLVKSKQPLVPPQQKKP